MSRLPIPGQDANVWGSVLNDFLSVEHNANGTLKIRSDGTLNFYTKPANGIPSTDMTAAVQTQLNAAGKVTVAKSGTTVGTRSKLNVISGSNTTLSVVDDSVNDKVDVTIAASDVINALDYGAVFDGSTDDASALQSAINAAQTTHKPLVLPAGTSIIGTTLNVSQPLTILGSGRDVTVLRAKSGLNNYIMTFSGGSAGVGIVAAHLSDFTLDGNLSGQTTGGGILALGAVQSVFERLHFTNCYNWGMELGPITGGAFGHHNRVFNCLFDNSGTSFGYGGGLWLTSSDENFIVGCDFENLGGASAPTGTSPIMLYDLAGLQTITACCFVGGSNNCIGVRLQNVQRSRVVNCTFDGTAGDSVFLVTNKCLVANNTITGPGTVGTIPASGVHLEFDTNYNVVVNNILVTSDTSGKTRSLIREESTGGSSNNFIEGNSLTWGANGPTIALVESAGTNTIVRNNLAWATEANGTATVLSGTTSIAVTHGLAVTPALANISVTPTNNLGSATRFWISNPTNTQFTINVDVNPGATTATFAWMIRM